MKTNYKDYGTNIIKIYCKSSSYFWNTNIFYNKSLSLEMIAISLDIE